MGELVEGVVDRGKRHRNAAGLRLLVEGFGRHVPIAADEEQRGQRNALPRRPQARSA